MDIPFSKIIDLIKDPDLKIKISELVSENLQLKEENFRLRKRIEDQQEQKEIGDSLVHENNHYYRKSDSQRLEPLCTKCWDSDKKLINLHKHSPYNGIQNFSCPVCKTNTHLGTVFPPSSQNFGTDY